MINFTVEIKNKISFHWSKVVRLSRKVLRGMGFPSSVPSAMSESVYLYLKDLSGSQMFLEYPKKQIRVRLHLSPLLVSYWPPAM